jgi:protein-tyrosine-phosphatase
MAEAFANRYGSDVLEAKSAGLMPVSAIDSGTMEVMLERGIDVSAHVPSLYVPQFAREFDLLVNLSGTPLRQFADSPAATIDWNVTDPYREDVEVYRSVRDEIERLVMLLILDLRSARRKAAVSK